MANLVGRFDLFFSPRCLCDFTYLSWIAMTAAQARIGDTINLFYGAADRTSDGALAGHSYKQCVDDLDSIFIRERVCYRFYRLTHIIISYISRTHPIALQFLTQLEWGKCAHTSVNEHIAKRNKR